MADKTRGMDPSKIKIYTDAYEKEAHLRLKWFRKNEDRLEAYTAKPNSRTVPGEILDKIDSDRQERYQGIERYPRYPVEDVPPPLIDPNAIYNTMKPVDPTVTRLIYQGK